MNSGVVRTGRNPMHATLWTPIWWWRARRGRNPLLRRFSPVERVATSLVGVVTLVGILATAIAMTTVNIAGVTRSQHDNHTRHQVPATVLSMSADPNPDAATEGAVPASFTQRLSWTWHNRTHVGEQSSVSALPAGTTTTVWVDDTGELAMTPWSTTDTAITVTTVGAAGTVATALLTILAWILFDRWLCRRRAELWQVEWAQIAPTWSGNMHQ